MGSSTSISTSEQAASAYMSQQFSGSCDITCSNIAENVSIDLINSIVGGSINLTQTCSVDASCMVSNSSDATSDIMFKAANSTNAKNASNLYSGDLFNADWAQSSSRQNIKQKIIQNTTETCKMASLNQMKDISILAANSVIGGSINIGQTGSTSGQCQLSNNFSAAASATAMASNTATSGKDKKGQKGGFGILAIIVLAVVVYIVAKFYVNNRNTDQFDSESQAADIARAKAGCLGGVKPMMDSSGNPIIDPRTHRPVCPPPNVSGSK
jgi:hypothetical protein